MAVSNKEWQYYLAGKMDGLTFNEMNQWREEAALKLKVLSETSGYKCTVINPCDFYNPVEDVRYQTDEEVMDYDINHLENSDFVIVNADGLGTSTGTQIEIFDAWKNNIPVFVFGVGRGVIHPWLERCVTRFEPNLDYLITYLTDFYYV